MTSLRSFVSRAFALALVSVLGLGLQAGCGGSGTTQAMVAGDGGIQAPVSIDPPNHTFGDVLVGQSSEPKMFTVRNTAAGSLSAVMATAAGTAASQFVVTGSCSGALGRNATCLVSVVFKPTSIGDKSATLDILAGGGKRSAMLSGRATSPARVTAAQMDLSFGSVTVGSASDPKPVTITNEGSMDAAGLEVRVSGEMFEKGMGSCPAMLKAGESCMQPIVFKPTSVGAKMGTVTISMSGTTAQPVVIQLLGTGVARPSVAASPAALEFDPVGVGRTGAASVVTLRNPGESPLSGFSATIASTDFRVTNGCPGTIPPGMSCSVMVSFTPKSTGSKRGELALSVMGGDAVGIPLSGKGLAASRLVLSPNLPTDRPSFVPVPVGSASPELTLTIANEGEEQIDQLKIESSDGKFAVRHSCGTRLLPNATPCPLVVVFTPTAEGAAMATIRVTGSVGTTALMAAEATVSGTGVRRPTITIVPADRDFGTVTVGQTSAPTTFTITNTGGAATGTLRLNTQVPDFRILAENDSCSERMLQAGGTCSLTVVFAPTAAGQRSSPLTAVSDQAGSAGAMLSGRGLVGAQLAVDRASASFGTVGLGQTSNEVIITVTNRGDVESGVVQLSTGSSQFVIGSNGCQNQTLTPGESCSASVRFTAANVGDFATNLIASASPGGSITTALTATGAAPAAIAFQQADGSNVTVLTLSADVGVQAVATVFLRNTGMISSGMLATAIEGANAAEFSVVEGSSTCGAPLPPGGQCSITISFRPTAAGSRTATINVRAGAGGVASLLLQGTSRGQLEIESPLGTPISSFSFPDRAAGLVSEDQEFFLRARAATGTFTITFDGGASPPSFARAGGTCETTAMLAANGTCTIRVRFQPQSIGPKTGSLRVTTSDGVSVTLALSGNGTGPLQFSPRPHNFGDREAGTTTDYPFVLTNSGPHPMTAVAVTLTGSSDYVIAGDTCATAPPAGLGGTCTVTVRFVPTTPGAKSATLSATGTFTAAGATQMDTATAAISGNATAAAQIAVDPAEHDFGSVAVASAGVTRTFTVSNGSGRPTTGGISFDPAGLTDDYRMVRNGCLLADNTSARPLAAGESCTFDVRFIPTATGLRTGILRVFGNPGGSVAVRLGGTGISTLVIEPGAQDFDAGGTLNVVGQTNSRREFVITNRGAAALALAVELKATDVIGATADGVTYFQLFPSTMAGAVCPTALGGGASCRVEVAMVTPTGATAGKKFARLEARSTPAATTATAVSELSGTLRADAALAYVDGNAPREFGGVKVNEVSGAHLVQVQNRGSVSSGPLTVTIPANFESTQSSGTNAATGNPVCVTGEPLAPNAICDILLRFRPNTALGTLSGTLRVSASGFGAASGNQDKALSGVGLPVGGIYLAPTPADFGTATPGIAAPVERTLTVTNDTGVAVAVAADGVTASGAGFSVSGQTCSPTIAFPGTCTVTTRFQPDQAATAATVTGTLQVVGTPAGAAPLTAAAAIQGRVVVPVLRIEAAAEGASWGEALVGVANQPRVFTIRNVGGAPTASAPVVNVTGAQATDFALPPESNGCGVALAPNAACTVTIALTAAASGARGATLNASAGPAVASQPLSANGVLPSAIQVVSIGGAAGAATAVDYGSKAVGSETGIDVVIKNADSGQRIAVPTFALGDPINFRVDTNPTSDTNPATSTDCFERAQDGLQGGPPGESCTIRIFFRPQSLPAAGTATPNFSTTLAVGGAATPLTLNLRGHAVSALSITPDNRTFGSQAVNGTTSVTTFTVSHSGDAGIPATGQVAVALTGPDAASFRITRNECTGMTLARAGMGDSDCQVDVVFEPKSTGAKAATLSVTASPTNGAAAALTGTGS